MKFSIRDLLWLVAVLGAAVVFTGFGFFLGDARKRMILEMDNSMLRLERHTDRARIEVLELELTRAGIPLPEKD
jgi:hypothetical protein